MVNDDFFEQVLTLYFAKLRIYPAAIHKPRLFSAILRDIGQSYPATAKISTWLATPSLML
jgi:hypothetical protein